MRTVTRRLAPLTLVVVLAGCGSITESITERVVEEGIEAANGEGIEVDIDTDGDGGLSVTSSDGNFEIGAQGVPEDWPDDIVFPSDIAIMSSSSGSSGSTDETTTYTYTGTVAGGDLAAVIAEFSDAAEDRGFEEQSASDFNGDGQTGANRVWQRDDETMSAALSTDDEGVFVIFSSTLSN